MVGMADRDSEGVGGVGARQGAAGKKTAHHHLDLGLVGMADTDHRFLDEIGRIFMDGYTAFGGNQKYNAAGDPEFQGGGGILVDEGLFNRGFIGLIAIEDRVQSAKEIDETFGERQLVARMGDTIGNVAQLVAVDVDDAPAGMAQAWIEAEQSHGIGGARGGEYQALSRAMTSSETSKFA